MASSPGGWLSSWPASDPVALDWTAWVLVAWLAIGFARARWPRWRVAGLGLAFGVASAAVVRSTWLGAPVSAGTLSWIRLSVALAALGVVARPRIRGATAPAHSGLGLGVLGVTGALGLFCFVNLGRPQFVDAGRNQPTFLHHYDMRVYFPIARYFPELRFDGVYAASVEAVAEDGGNLDALKAQTLRNLKTNELQTVGESKDFLLAVRARFTPERWALFLADMRYFRQGMGEGGFLGSIQDHGGNATPVWFLGARLLFRNAPASDFTLWVGVAVDVLLMLLAFAALGWAYGPRTALVAMTVFGAMDFYQFGSNWFGAPLRHDWMALWGIGLALVKKQRLFLGGGLLAWAALIRVFPVLSLMTVTAPVAWALVQKVRAQRGNFAWRGFLGEHREFLRIALGAAVFGGVLFAASVAVFGWASWPDWLRKASMVSGPGLNTIALGSVAPNPVLWGFCGVAATFAVLFAIRHAPLEEAAGFGPALVGIVFSPSNYYLHSLMLLAVLGGERRPGPWLVLLAMCVGCFFTTLPASFEAHFRAESWVMLAAVVALTLWRVRARGAEQPFADGPVPRG